MLLPDPSLMEEEGNLRQPREGKEGYIEKNKIFVHLFERFENISKMHNPFENEPWCFTITWET